MVTGQRPVSPFFARLDFQSQMHFRELHMGARLAYSISCQAKQFPNLLTRPSPK